MLSFYEMDCLLQKSKEERLRKDEIFDDSHQDTASSIIAKLNAAKQSQPQQAAPAPAPAAPAPSLRKQNLAQAGNVGGGQQKLPAKIIDVGDEDDDFLDQPETPARVINTPDPNEPGSPQNLAAKERYGIDQAKRIGKGEGGTGPRGRKTVSIDNDSQAEKLKDRWEKMVGSVVGTGQVSDEELEGGIQGESGETFRMSSWAGKLQMALQAAGVPVIDSTTGKPLPVGHAFKLRYTPVADPAERFATNPKDLPEVIIPPRLLQKGVKKFKEMFGNNRTGEKDHTEKSNSLLGTFFNDFNRATKNNDRVTLDIITRATQFVHALYKNVRNDLGKTNTVRAWTNNLASLSPKPRTPDGQPMPRDPALDFEAMKYMLSKAKKNKDRLVVMPDQEATPESIVQFLDPAGNWSDEEKAGMTMGGHREKRGYDPSAPVGPMADPQNLQRAKLDSLDPKERIAQWRKAQAAARMQQKQRGLQDPSEFEESRQWQDIYNLMEHWGF